MNRLLIVSNRLPVTTDSDSGEVDIAQSSGGLATALRLLHLQTDSLWFGWPGDVSHLDASGHVKAARLLSNMRAIPIYLTPTEVARYYEGFSNGVLRPLFHYMTDHLQRDAWQDWRGYAQVNQRFAETLVRYHRPGDVIWVHNYHLTLLPGLLRSMLPDARIGYSLHIPFPSSDVFQVLPWRKEILGGLLGADLIGFCTHSSLVHFRRALFQFIGLEEDSGIVRDSGKEIHLGVFPMGIDADRIAGIAEEEVVIAGAETIRTKAGNRKLIVGVDRLDHTNGLLRRMLAIERFFERNQSVRDTVRLMQVVTPSRLNLDSDSRLRKQLDEVVGRINGAYSTFNSAPIHYLYRSMGQGELVALYRAADVMMATPLRDEMSLVAKEFVASRTDGDGVLMLSEFAGAASELRDAILVNPYDIDGVAGALERSLLMQEEERRLRMMALRARVNTDDTQRWAGSFIEAVQSEETIGWPAVQRCQSRPLTRQLPLLPECPRIHSSPRPYCSRRQR